MGAYEILHNFIFRKYEVITLRILFDCEYIGPFFKQQHVTANALNISTVVSARRMSERTGMDVLNSALMHFLV